MSKSGFSNGFLGASKGGIIGGSPLTDVSDATNLAVTAPIVLTDDTLSINYTATSTEINTVCDGDTTGAVLASSLTNTDQIVVNDGGTMKQVALSHLETWAETNLDTLSNVTSLGTLTTLTVDNVIINGTTIGHTSDTDLITLTEDTVTVAGAMNATTVGGTLSTAAQTNVTSLGTLTALTVDNIAIDGTTIGHTSDTDLLSLADGELTLNGNMVIQDDGWIGQNSTGDRIIFDTNGNHIQFRTGMVDFVLGSMRAEFNTTGLKLGDYVYGDSTDGVQLEFGSPNAHIVCSDTDGILTFDCATHFEQNITVAEDTEISIGGDSEKIVFNGGSARIDLVAGQVFVGSGGGNGYLASYGDADTWIRYQSDQISLRAGGTDYIDITTSGVNFGDNTVSRPKLKDFSETVHAVGNVNSSTAFDFENGNVQTVTVSGIDIGSTITWSLTNPPASGTAGVMTVIFTNALAHGDIAFDSSIKWPGDVAPTMSSSGVDILTFITIDAGTTYYGFVGGIAFA
tara:strand:- start:1366 stop:2904 length:1539 start_codon:yes stop_codon:yes gene_type:complete